MDESKDSELVSVKTRKPQKWSKRKGTVKQSGTTHDFDNFEVQSVESFHELDNTSKVFPEDDYNIQPNQKKKLNKAMSYEKPESRFN